MGALLRGPRRTERTSAIGGVHGQEHRLREPRGGTALCLGRHVCSGTRGAHHPEAGKSGRSAGVPLAVVFELRSSGVQVMTNDRNRSGAITRRDLLTRAGLAALGAGVLPLPARAIQSPAAPVALARCPSYGAELLPTLTRMFDQLGGLGGLVKGKTVAIKVNMTGNGGSRLGFIPIGCTTWTHPAVIGATVHLMGRAGAKRIRLLESPWK